MPEIRYSAGDNETQVYLYGPIGPVFDGYSDVDVVTLLDAVPDQPINLRINSEGGLVFPGMAIFQLLRADQRVKTVTIDAIAASISSVIAMAGERIVAAAESQMMIHNPYAMTMGDFREFESMAGQLRATREQIAGTYARRGSRDAEYYANLMSDETWLTANQAQDIGLIDEVTEEPAPLRNYIWDHCAKVPDEFRRHGKPAPPKVRAAIEMRRRLLELQLADRNPRSAPEVALTS